MENRKVNIEAPALGCLVGRAYQLMLKQLEKGLKDAGLEITPNEYLILRSLYVADGQQQCEIAESIGKDKAMVCRCVSLLERKHLIYTVSVSHKCLRVFLTDKAKTMQPSVMEVAMKRHKALTELSTPENIKIFNDILNQIINTHQKGILS